MPDNSTTGPGRLGRPTACLAALSVAALGGVPAWAAGTPAGTIIESTATVDFDLAGTPLSLQSNTTAVTVSERLDVVATPRSPQVPVSPGDADRATLFRVTNTGNGSESFALSIDNSLVGDDFDPVAAVPAIYFDSDGSGDLNAGDEAYAPGSNDPVLAADASIDVLVVNDIPGTTGNGDIGFTELTATALTGTGAPGTEYAGLGDGGVDAIVGSTGGAGAATGEYLVSDVLVSIVKAQSVSDPLGGSEPLPSSTITYTVTVEVTSAGTATAAVLRDAIPTWTTFTPASITLNGAALSDASDADAGEFDASGTPSIVVRLGDLTQADGVQTVAFSVTID